MAATLLKLLPVLALTAALPNPNPNPTDSAPPAASSSFPVGSTMSFSAFDGYHSTVYLSGNVAPVPSGSCYPHNVAQAYVSYDKTAALTFKSTGPQKKNGHTPVALNVGSDGCWVAAVVQGLFSLGQAGEVDEGWYVNGTTLGNINAPNGFYYCKDLTGGKGWIGMENGKKMHEGGVYTQCYTTDFTINQISIVG